MESSMEPARALAMRANPSGALVSSLWIMPTGMPLWGPSRVLRSRSIRTKTARSPTCVSNRGGTIPEAQIRRGGGLEGHPKGVAFNTKFYSTVTPIEENRLILVPRWAGGEMCDADDTGQFGSVGVE